MGKKKISTASVDNVKKLSQQKRHELDQLVDHLLKLCFDSSGSDAAQLWAQYNEIQKALQRIQLVEGELKPKASNRNRAAFVRPFVEWAKRAGAQFDGVHVAQYPNYEFGLEATKDFCQNQIFATIPKRMILSLDNASEAARGLLDKLPVLDAMPNVKLAVALLAERFIGAESNWKAYIDFLPDKYPTVMNFTAQELNELRGSSAFVPALNQCKNIARQYAFIRKAITSFRDQTDAVLQMMRDRFTYDLYK